MIDPVAQGLVPSLAHPGGNITGFSAYELSGIGGKWLGLLKEVAPRVVRVGLLFNPNTAPYANYGAEAAARDTNQTLEIVTARNESEIVATFASLNERRIGALIIGSDSFYLGQMRWMAALAAHNRVPVIGPLQDFTAAGGLMNYGPSIADGVRQAGVYVGRVLKGARPADLPVVLAGGPNAIRSIEMTRPGTSPWRRNR